MGAVGSWPVERRGDEAFLAGLGKNIAETVDLGGGFVADQDGLVAARPEMRGPIDQAADLTGEVGVEVLHEAGEAMGIGDGEQEMVVVGEEGEGVDSDRVEALGSAKDTKDDFAALLVRPHEVAALDRPAGDLDEASSFGNVAQPASHAILDGKRDSNLSGILWNLFRAELVWVCREYPLQLERPDGAVSGGLPLLRRLLHGLFGLRKCWPC